MNVCVTMMTIQRPNIVVFVTTVRVMRLLTGSKNLILEIIISIKSKNRVKAEIDYWEMVNQKAPNHFGFRVTESNELEYDFYMGPNGETGDELLKLFVKEVTGRDDVTFCVLSRVPPEIY